MCRSIKTLFNFEPPATKEEIDAAALQFVRKLSGFNKPSKANEIVFYNTMHEVSKIADYLLKNLVTDAEPKDREVEKALAKARNEKRFGVKIPEINFADPRS